MNTKLLLLIILFTFLRMINLDRDLPQYELTQLGSKDEQAYNFTALNLYHFGGISKEVVEGYRIKGTISTILNNFVTYLNLVVFGNNYYGLRAGAALASLVILIIMLHLLGLYQKTGNNGLNRFLLLFVWLFVLFDFGFLVAGRNASPVIFRSMYMMLLMLFMNFVAKKPGKLQMWLYVLCGLLSALLIFFSYLTNTFIALGAVLFIAFKGLNDHDFKGAIKLIMVFGIGFIIGFLISNQIYIMINGSGILSSLFTRIDVYGNRLAVPVKTHHSFAMFSVIKRIVSNILFVFHTNVLTLNYTLFFLLITAFSISIFQIVKKIKLSNVQLMSFSMIIAYFIQAMIYNPHPSKWIIMIFPAIIIFIITTIINAYQTIELMDYLTRNRRNIRIYLAIVFLFIAVVFVIWLKFKTCTALNPLAYISFATVSSVIMVLFLSFERIFKVKIGVVATILIVSMLPNLYLSFENTIFNPVFYYRDALKTVNEIVKDDIVAGSWSDGFRLYTKGNTIFTWYQNKKDPESYKTKLTEIFDKGIALYTMDYSTRSTLDVFKDINTKDKNYRMEIDTTLYLGIKTTTDSLIVVKRVALND